MKEFDSITINNQSYKVPGFCGGAYKAIVIDCDELINLFKHWEKEGTIINGIFCYRFGEEQLASSEKYIVDFTKGNEAEFFPVK